MAKRPRVGDLLPAPALPGIRAGRCQRVLLPLARNRHNVFPRSALFCFGSDWPFRRIPRWPPRFMPARPTGTNRPQPGGCPIYHSRGRQPAPPHSGRRHQEHQPVQQLHLRVSFWPGTWKLQGLPSSQVSGHLSRRHAGKGPIPAADWGEELHLIVSPRTLLRWHTAIVKRRWRYASLAASLRARSASRPNSRVMSK